MQIKEYIDIFKKEFNAKIIEFEEIKKYLPAPDFYGNNFNIATVSEREICSDNFTTLILKGSNVDPTGKLDKNWGISCIIIFVEYNEQKEVVNACMLSSYNCKDAEAESKLYNLIDCYKNK